MAIVTNSTSGLCTWSGWAGVTTSAKTLSVTAEVDIDNNGGTSYNSLSYTLDGTNWTSFFASSQPLPSTTFTATVPAGTNLANVAVTASSHCSATRVDGDEVDAALTISGLQIS